MERARQGTRRGTDLGNDHPKSFINHNLHVFKILSDGFGSSDLQILYFYKLLPLQLLLTFAILNRSLELKETDAYFRDEVAI